MIKRIALAACCAFFPALHASEADGLLGTSRSRLFDEYVEQIASLQVVSESGMERMHTSWAEELKRSKQRFLAAKTRDDVFYAILSLHYSFHDIHSSIDLKPLEPSGSRVIIPVHFAPRLEGSDWVYVVDSKNSPVTGAKLDSMDGQSVAELENAFREWSPSSSMDSLRFDLADWLSSREPFLAPAPAAGSKTKLKFSAGQEIEMVWEKAPSHGPTEDPKCGRPGPQPDYAALKPEFIGLGFCVYPGPAKNTKIVRYFSFRYWFDDAALWNRISDLSYKPKKIDLSHHEGLAEFDQRELVKWLNKVKVKKIYLDLRENTGGNLPLILPAAFASEPFNSTKLKLWLSPALRKNPELFSGTSSNQTNALKKQLLENHDEYSRELPFFCTSPECLLSEAMLEPTRELAGVQLVVISGPHCLSACDQ